MHIFTIYLLLFRQHLGLFAKKYLYKAINNNFVGSSSNYLFINIFININIRYEAFQMGFLKKKKVEQSME